jgi:transcriptional regulator with XRE-family HTH domain
MGDTMRGSGNQMRELRESKKLSQRQLAELVRTSQAQIQRIEAGVQAARLDLAIRIAEALGTSLEGVFPGLRQALGRGVSGRSTREVADDHKLNRSITEAGVDPDLDAWFALCLLRGGAEVKAPIPSNDLQRLQRWLDKGGSRGRTFFVWDSKGVTLLLNPRHLLHAHLIFEAEASAQDEPEKPIDLTEQVRVFLADRAEPRCFEVDPDPPGPRDDPQGELGALWMEAQGELEEGRFLHFTDANGEEVWLRADDVALVEIPLWALHPELIPDPDTGETKG